MWGKLFFKTGLRRIGVVYLGKGVGCLINLKLVKL